MANLPYGLHVASKTFMVSAADYETLRASGQIAPPGTTLIDPTTNLLVGVVQGDGTVGLNAPAIQALVSAYGTAVVEVTPYTQKTATGIAFTGACEYAGYDVVAVTASPTLTIYDGTDTSGTVILPATTISVGRNERTFKLALTVGCYIVIVGTATVNMLVG